MNCDCNCGAKKTSKLTKKKKKKTATTNQRINKLLLFLSNVFGGSFGVNLWAQRAHQNVKSNIFSFGRLYIHSITAFCYVQRIYHGNALATRFFRKFVPRTKLIKTTCDSLVLYTACVWFFFHLFLAFDSLPCSLSWKSIDSVVFFPSSFIRGRSLKHIWQSIWFHCEGLELISKIKDQCIHWDEQFESGKKREETRATDWSVKSSNGTRQQEEKQQMNRSTMIE